MLNFLRKKTVLFSSLIAMLIMFVIAILIVNRGIDGGDGSSILGLQLAFDKQLGIEIVERWGAQGRAFYNSWAFTDYIYAVCYGLFFASLLAILSSRAGKPDSHWDLVPPLIALSAAAMDCLENAMEYIFVQNPADFPADLFFFHSIITVCKWAALMTAVVIAFVLALRQLVQASAPTPQKK